MAFKKGQPKPSGSGRKPGSKNKSTLFGTDTILAFLNEYKETGQMAKDWKDMEARDRMAMAEKMMHYIMPKQASVTAEVNASISDSSVEDTLIKLAQEQ